MPGTTLDALEGCDAVDVAVGSCAAAGVVEPAPVGFGFVGANG
jgi:hypothetical protein